MKIEIGNSWFLSVLTLLFVALKLTGYISWSWWWITAPIWGGFLFLGALIAIFAVFANKRIL